MTLIYRRLAPLWFRTHDTEKFFQAVVVTILKHLMLFLQGVFLVYCGSFSVCDVPDNTRNGYYLNQLSSFSVKHSSVSSAKKECKRWLATWHNPQEIRTGIFQVRCHNLLTWSAVKVTTFLTESYLQQRIGSVCLCKRNEDARKNLFWGSWDHVFLFHLIGLVYQRKLHV